MTNGTLGILLIVILAGAVVVFVIFARRLFLASFFPRSRPQPQEWAALIVRGYARRDAGDVRGALADFSTVLKAAPNHPEAPALRAEMERLNKQTR
jgi:hypothetical protein